MMMGLAIAHYIREQVVFYKEPIIVPPHHQFSVEKERDVFYDFGEVITII